MAALEEKLFMSVKQVATLLLFGLGPIPLLQPGEMVAVVGRGAGVRCWSGNKTEKLRMPTSLRAASPWQPQMGKKANFILNQVWSFDYDMETDISG